MANVQKLGYDGDDLWIKFNNSICRFPATVKLSDCAKKYLEDNDWQYVNGNGCGTNTLGRLLLRVYQAIVIDIDLGNVCNLHDLEYTMADPSIQVPCVRTKVHKQLCDLALRENIIIYATMYSESTIAVKILAYIYWLAVKLFGDKFYWKLNRPAIGR